MQQPANLRPQPTVSQLVSQGFYSRRGQLAHLTKLQSFIKKCNRQKQIQHQHIHASSAGAGGGPVAFTSALFGSHS